jgi:uncharacterized membrane protein HdeD (DUF308 family)
LNDDQSKERKMLEALIRYWWLVVLRGVAAVIFGVLALVWPDITLFVLVIMFGAYAFVDGLFTLGTAFFGDRRGRRGWLIVEGIAGIVIGLITFFWPSATALALLWLIAAWALITGVLEIAAAIRLRKEIRGEWLLALAGVLSVVVGILLVIWPTTGALAVVFLIGIYAVAFGVALVFLGFHLRTLRGTRAPAAPGRPATA